MACSSADSCHISTSVSARPSAAQSSKSNSISAPGFSAREHHAVDSTPSSSVSAKHIDDRLKTPVSSEKLLDIEPSLPLLENQTVRLLQYREIYAKLLALDWWCLTMECLGSIVSEAEAQSIASIHSLDPSFSKAQLLDSIFHLMQDNTLLRPDEWAQNQLLQTSSKRKPSTKLSATRVKRARTSTVQPDQQSNNQSLHSYAGHSDHSSTAVVDYDLCVLCNKSAYCEDTVLLCDGCDIGCHLKCVRPRLYDVPTGDWFCVNCDINQPVNQSINNARSDAEDEPLVESINQLMSRVMYRLK